MATETVSGSTARRGPFTPDCAVHMLMMPPLVAEGESNAVLWRVGVLQILDWYESARKFHGPDAGIAVFDAAPTSTGDPGLDAAFAALADWLAERDGWTPPPWTSTFVADEPWYVSTQPGLRELAKLECPQAFQAHNVWVSAHSLARA